MKNKLRIGLLLDGDKVPAWAYQMLEKLVHSNYAAISLKIQNQPPLQKSKKDLLPIRIWKNRHSLAYILYQRFDQKKFSPEKDAFEEKDISTLFHAPTLLVSPIQKKFSDTFPKEDVEKIRSYDLDILIRLGFRILRGDILRAAKCGIWSYHHGDNTVNRGGPAGFWEVMNQWDETGVILQILNEDLDNGIILHRAFSSTRKRSATENRNNYFWKAASILPHKAEECWRDGYESFVKKHRPLNEHPGFYSQRLFTEPTNAEMVKGFLKLVGNKIKLEIHHLFYQDQWILLFYLGKEAALSTSFFRFKRMLPPKDRFWADPHVMQKEDKFYIFIEELIYQKKKGHISVIEMDEKGKYGAPRVVLDKPYHLSYPFVFEENGEWYMIPESHENKTIELYKCISLPDKWELQCILLKDTDAVDTTLWKKDGIYYLFTTLKAAPQSDEHDSLCIFYSSTLESNQWTPHPCNPIKNDIKKGRMAGKLFMHRENLYRPAQDGARHYGHSMHIQHITKLNTTEYEENTIASIQPEWDKDLLSTHTFSHAGRLTCIDALIKRRK
jgi:hypothetical protein